MSLTADTIPVLIGQAIDESLKKALVYRSAYNENFQGELAYGSALKVPSIGSVSTGSYTRYSDISWENVTDDSVTLTVDQQSYYAVKLDSLDQIQARPDIAAAYAAEAVYSLQDTIDQYLVSTITGASGLIQTNLGDTGSPIDVDSTNAYEALLEAARQLDDAKVSRAGRYCIVPPWFMQKLTLGNVELATNNGEELSNGIVGRVAGFDLAVSHNVPAVGSGDDEYQIIAGTSGAATMALQLQRTEAITLPNTFATGLRGIALYGAKVIKPGAIALLTATEGAEA